MAAQLYDLTVWYDAAQKMHGLANRVRGLTRVGHVVLVVAHFRATLDLATSSLREEGITLHRYVSDSTVLCGVRTEGDAAWLALAHEIAHGPVPSLESAGDTSSLAVLVAEPHPLPDIDDAAIRAAASFPCHYITEVHASLADPLIEAFTGTSVKGMYRALGIDNGEPISHPMIAKSIRRAQEKIAKKVRQNVDADSAEEWFRVTMADRL